MLDSTPASFTLFPRLPAELRQQIWAMAVFPRTVALTFKKSKTRSRRFLHITSDAKVPGVLQACSESRRHAPYRQAFEFGRTPRYTWLNAEADKISLTFPCFHLWTEDSNLTDLLISEYEDWLFPNLTDITMQTSVGTVDRKDFVESGETFDTMSRLVVRTVRWASECTGFTFLIESVDAEIAEWWKDGGREEWMRDEGIVTDTSDEDDYDEYDSELDLEDYDGYFGFYNSHQ